MYGVASPSDRADLACERPPHFERSRGEARLVVAAAPGGGRVDRVYQGGAFRLRFPRVPGVRVPEAVLINTAGGVTGGDRFDFACEARDDAAVAVTTQAAEKVYRSAGGEAEIVVRLTAGARARLDWMPQETILFDGGRLRRRIEAEVAADGRLLLCECAVLGRTAHGETVRRGLFHDSWRVRRGGRLVYADETRLEGEMDRISAGPATLGGARAFASLLLVAPDAEGLVEPARAALGGVPAEAGASGWNGMLAARLVAESGFALRQAIRSLLHALDVKLPRVWNS